MTTAIFNRFKVLVENLSIFFSGKDYTKLIKFFPCQLELKGLEARH
ncbi:hypothetical protein CPS_3073 [Colwellia psychrerythraea 34H]|uniref:Uncharacterized protein n=1 Tax=Colwellia psychrerythraea (strain 34H / ATCC BAA-681) TaxID=167879 RepID=Q47ZJ9_COLP3|nr:hypothetical protein CPS_3073 [Colwellia psychrerythraea 34H]